jgi:hypothetical protein
MKMKKIIFTMLIVTLATKMVASEPIQYGVVAGMNSSNYSTFSSARIGFHVGGFAEIPVITKNLFLCPSAQLSLKGADVMGNTWSPYYLDIPIYMKYKFVINNNISFFGSAGPTISFGIFGEAPGYDYANYSADGDVLRNYNLFSGANASLNRFDIGLGFNVGAEFSKRYQLSIGYDNGLLNATKDTNTFALYNRVLKISLAYLF